jgi:hypothetical protein
MNILRLTLPSYRLKLEIISLFLEFSFVLLAYYGKLHFEHKGEITSMLN